jgi:pilus assembly protein CpaF
MFTIIIQEKGGEQRRMVFNKPEVTIGRVQGNDIVLPKGNVSKRHARIVLKDGKFIIVDLKSTNGTYVNGRKITSPLVVKDSDKIYIGDFIVGVDEAASADADGGSETTTSPPGDRIVPPAPEIRPPRPTEAQPMAPMPPIAAPDPIAPPPPIAPPRPGPPRPAPGGAARDLGAREPGPLGGPTREPGAMPPISPPPGDRPRPLGGRPGGTMPPPMAPIPPVAPSPGPPHADMAPPAPMPAMPAPRPEFGAAASAMQPSSMPGPAPHGPGAHGPSGTPSTVPGPAPVPSMNGPSAMPAREAREARDREGR